MSNRNMGKWENTQGARTVNKNHLCHTDRDISLTLIKRMLNKEKYISQ